MSKLNRNQVEEILRRVKNNERLTYLAKEFGVTKQLIHQIVHRKIWLAIDCDDIGAISKKGFNCPTAKLNEEQVLEIKKMFIERKTIREIQKLYNVSYSCLVHIAKGYTWKHVGDKIKDIEHGITPRGEKHHNAKLTEANVKDIREKFKNGVSKSSLAREFKVSCTSINRICDNKTWKDVK